MTAAPGSSRSAQTEVVFVVDDDEAVRDSLRWLLEGQGFRVTAFESAERFLASLPAGANGPLPGCLIADVRMPGMSGTELHDELIRRAIDLPIPEGARRWQQKRLGQAGPRAAVPSDTARGTGPGPYRSRPTEQTNCGRLEHQHQDR